MDYYLDMNKKGFKKRSISETLMLLCEVAGDPLFKNGKINQSALRKKSGVDQSLLSRVIAGDTKTMTDKNALSLAKVFKVNSAQIRGEEPISYIDGGVDKSVDEIVGILSQLSENQVWEVLRHCQILQESNNR